MEIKNAVTTSEVECTDLYMSVIATAIVVYPSPEEQNAAIAAAMPKFKVALDALVTEAYNLNSPVVVA
jgi:hypothetical protein